MSIVLSWTFWFSMAVLIYVYAGFTLLVIAYARLRNYQVRQRPITPNMTLIIAAFNEEHSISSRIENALNLNYPATKLELIVASDGSTDATEAIAESYAHKGVRLLSLHRRGKIYAVDEAVNRSSGEIIVFSDANTLFQPDALLMLARNFADPEVGGVCGNQIYVEEKCEDGSGKGENLYWSFDKWLKSMESLTGSIVSADGAIYAVRRSLYRMPANTGVTDDFAISTSVVEQGYRLVFEPGAIAYERTSSKAENEFVRKIRIINRGLRGVILRRNLLNPFRYGFYSVTLFTHKILRRTLPIFLLLLLASNVFLFSHGVHYQAALIGQVLFYGFACAGYFLRSRKPGHWKLFYIPFFYCLVNLAALSALFKLLCGKRFELWQPRRNFAEAN
ncbi:MAG: glycosyltransferase family 2 protein [bacterium]